MSWLLFAFSGPLLWAVSFHIDKYLVERYFKKSPVAILMVFTALIGLVMLPFIWWFRPQVLSLPWSNTLVMMASGILYMAAMLFYLHALQSEEASIVAPLFQISPLFGYLLAYLVLGEILTHTQMAGAALIVFGALTLTIRPGVRRSKKIKKSLVLWMLACTFALALSSVIFKFFAVQDEYWMTTFWTYVGHAIFGVGILCVPSYWRQLVALMRKNTRAVLQVNAANELINLGGGLGVSYATILAPVSLVQAISSTTILFVFLFGILLTIFLPKFAKEDLSRKNLLLKGAAAVLITIGVIVINKT